MGEKLLYLANFHPIETFLLGDLIAHECLEL